MEVLRTLDEAGTTAINLTGNETPNELRGNEGANTLDGGGGADILRGFGGNDTYIVDNAGDVVMETDGGGSDTVKAGVSYALGAGVKVEMLRTANDGGTAAINLSGNEIPNELRGNDGANTLDGGGGLDILRGFGGNDTYIVDNASDVVVEAAGFGSDTIKASVSYSLAAGASVETLATTDDNGTAAISLTGNEIANTLRGNAADNVINGGGGADILRGLGGSDSYIVDNVGDMVEETAGFGTDTVLATVSYALAAGVSVEVLRTLDEAGTTAMMLSGNQIANTVTGNNGSNIVDGGLGNDVLAGFGGQDTFLFSTTLHSTNNVDLISDYSVFDDSIALDDAVFTALSTTGTLAADHFVIGTAAQDGDDRIIYDNTTGNLYFDSDGTGGTAAVQFATLAASLALTNADFVVV